MSVVAAVCAALAVWLLVAPVGRVERLRVAPVARRDRRRRFVVVGACVAAAALLLVLPEGRWRVVGIVALLVAGIGTAFAAGRAGERRRTRARAEVARGCWELAGEVAAGRVPAEALRVVAADVPVLRRGWRVAELGGDVVPAWREQAREPGHEGLLVLARAWEVAATTGAPLASSLRSVAEQLRERRRLGHTVQGELAAPRATGRLLAGLPAAGVLMGYAFGGDPAAFLLDTIQGQVCLVVAVALGGAGLLWSERLADKAVRA